MLVRSWSVCSVDLDSSLEMLRPTVEDVCGFLVVRTHMETELKSTAKPSPRETRNSNIITAEALVEGLSI